jgi:Haem-binding domain
MARTRLIVRGAFIGLGVALAIQLVPVTRTNPPVESDVDAPAAVKAVLRRSCYNCHSNETQWPWYGYVAPVSWLVASDVSDARRHVDFSTWNRYTGTQRSRHIGEVWDQVSTGEMPPWDYLLMHRSASLSAADRAVLRAWSNGG